MNRVTGDGEHGPFVVMSAAYHRNGVGGTGFYVGQVLHARGGAGVYQIIVVPKTDDDGEPDTTAFWPDIFVVERERASAGDIAFGSNFHRGDTFQREARALLEQVEKNRDALLATLIKKES